MEDLKMNKPLEPKIYNIFKKEALGIKDTSFGNVGSLFRGERIEVVWVNKQNDEIDPGWFSQNKIDFICVLRGKLRVEYENDWPAKILQPGNFLILPPNTKCRAYRWPRENKKPTIFLAFYPITQD